MRQPLLNIAAVISLVLFFATSALWIRSYWHVDLFGREYPENANHWQRGGSVNSIAGLIRVEWWFRQNGDSSMQGDSGWAYNTRPLREAPTSSSSWHGFSYRVAAWDNAGPRSDGCARTQTNDLLTPGERPSLDCIAVLHAGHRDMVSP